MAAEQPLRAVSGRYDPARALAAGAPQERRVLMTADTVGGVWQFSMELCRALCASGDQVLLATMGPAPSPWQQREAAQVPGLVLHSRACALEWMQQPWQDVDAAGEWLLGLAHAFQPHVVHLNQLCFGQLAWPAPVLVTGHSCVLSWWRAVHGVDAPREWHAYQCRVRASLAAADMVTAPTVAMLEALQRHYGVLPRARAIANGRRLARAAATARRSRQSVVLAAGRAWDQGKNLGALAEVATSLPWPVCIAGDNAPPGQALAAAASAAWDNVRLLGRLSSIQLAHWYARAAIYALPACYEPFGLSALEAALSGCALVLGDIDSLREVWDDSAVYVQPGDPAALRAALLALMHDQSLREHMAQRAQDRARRYTPEAMARGYRRCYSELCLAHLPVPPKLRPVVAAGVAAGGCP